jgi:hypothetical protein
VGTEAATAVGTAGGGDEVWCFGGAPAADKLALECSRGNTMPDLLELIAENDASVLNDWAAVFRTRAPQISALPEGERRRELLTLAREFMRRAMWATETAEGWLTELKTRLRDGMGGDKCRALLRSGRALCGQCRSVVEIAGDLWRLAEAAGVPTGEAGTAQCALSGASRQLSTVESEINAVARVVERPPPEMNEELFENGKKQIEEGKWLTPEQARAAFLKSEGS